MIYMFVCSFLSGSAISALAAYAYHKARISVMETDVKVALRRQHETSYASGYMRGYAGMTKDRAEKAAARKRFDFSNSF